MSITELEDLEYELHLDGAVPTVLSFVSILCPD